MRARYTAYIAHDEAFLLATWHPETRPEAIDFSDDITWDGLDVITVTGGALDGVGSVEFRARFRRNAAPLELHELSLFERVDGKWVYREGLDPDTT